MEAYVRRSDILGVAVFTILFLAACAHTPDVALGYYLPKSSVSIRAIRTVACDQSNNPIVATTVTPAVKHSADPARRHELSMGSLIGPFSDTNLKFEFYDDGRLRAVNTSSVGQGEAILKSAATLATVVMVGFDRGGSASACTTIKNAVGDKALTLTYESPLLTGPNDLHKKQTIMPDGASGAYAQALRDAIGDVCAEVEDATRGVVPATYAQQNNDSMLAMRQPGSVKVKVAAALDCSNSDSGQTLWEGSIPVADYGTDYALPLPHAATFGKQNFGLAVSESGALSSVEYGSGTGAGQAVGATASALTMLKGETDAQRAAEIKGEADVIAQHQRLVLCKKDPSTCK